MAVLTADTALNTKQGIDVFSYPVADNVVIYKGSLVAIDTAGYARAAADTASYVCVGIADSKADNTISGHTAGGIRVTVLSNRVVTLPFTGTATQATVGVAAYVSDSATVAATATNYVEVGLVVGYNSATSVDVWLPPCGGAIPLSGLTATAGEINTLHSVTPGTTAASKALVVDSSKNLDTLGIATSLILRNGGKLELVPYTAGVQGATANVIDVTKSVQFWAVDSGTGAANAVTPSAAGTAGDILRLTYAATTGTVTMTFGAGFKSSGTLAVTVTHFATIEFQSDGTNWRETFRSAIITS